MAKISESKHKLTSYATVRCTYTELRTADNKKIFTVTAKDCAQFGVPFALENYQPLNEQERKMVNAYLKYTRGRMKHDDYVRVFRATFPQFGSKMKLGRKELLESVQIKELANKMFVKVMLTANGLDLIRKNAGAQRADAISRADLYVLSPSIKVVDGAHVEVEPDPTVGISKKSNVGKILLAVAGWLLFR